MVSAGFACAALRELVLVPLFGRAIGEPLETPFMLAAIIATAWLTVGWCRIPPGSKPRLAMGFLSLAFVLLGEFALSPSVRGSIQAWFESFTLLTLALSIVLWTAHAVMPFIVRRG